MSPPAKPVTSHNIRSTRPQHIKAFYVDNSNSLFVLFSSRLFNRTCQMNGSSGRSFRNNSSRSSSDPFAFSSDGCSLLQRSPPTKRNGIKTSTRLSTGYGVRRRTVLLQKTLSVQDNKTTKSRQIRPKMTRTFSEPIHSSSLSRSVSDTSTVTVVSASF